MKTSYFQGCVYFPVSLETQKDEECMPGQNVEKHSAPGTYGGPPSPQHTAMNTHPTPGYQVRAVHCMTEGGRGQPLLTCCVQKKMASHEGSHLL